MKNNIYIAIAIVFLLLTNKTFAQGCEGDLPVSNDSLSGPSVTIFGYIQPQYDYNFTDGNENEFKFKRARIGARGSIYKDFSYYFMLETSPFIGSSGDAYLMDAFVSYTKYNWAKISVGSFKQPFSLDVATPCHSLTTIDRSIVADQLVAPQRDMGLMVLGGNNYTKFNYWIALMNGRGLGSTGDDNTKKDMIGRVTYKITNYLTVGGSFRYGYPIPNNNDDTRTTIGGEFLLKLDKLAVQGEYIYDEGAYFSGASGGCGATPVALGEKRDGAYIMASYSVDEKIQPVFKYEFFDPNLDLKDDGSYMERMTIGANYFFNDKVRFQLNYQANIDTVINVDNDALLAQVQIKF